MNDLSREVMKTSVPFSCWNHGRARTCGFYKPLSQNAAIYSCPKHSSPQHKHLESIFSCGYDCIKIFHIFSLIHCENYLIFLFTTCSMAGTEGRGNCKRVPCSTHRPSWASQSCSDQDSASGHPVRSTGSARWSPDTVCVPRWTRAQMLLKHSALVPKRVSNRRLWVMHLIWSQLVPAWTFSNRVWMGFYCYEGSYSRDFMTEH